MSRMSQIQHGPRIALHRPGRRSRLVALVAVVATVTALTVVSASSGTLPQLQRSNSGTYTGILVTSTHRSLYALSVETGGVIHCRSACTPFWPPFLVKSTVTSVSLGAGVKGKIGFVKRSATMKQVTFNGYPVYRYAGDSGPLQSHGEGIHADGGTWHLLHAGASTPSTTLVKVHTSPTTTTTSGGYGY
jgi:predicted lipoprotein with Yx(FWY)xxD motif